MRVFVTGATGFIGGDYVRRVRGRGDEAICLVRDTSNTRKLDDLGARTVRGSMTDIDALTDIIADEDPDLIVHCAALVSAGNEHQLFDTNVNGTAAVCGAALRCGVDRMVYLSSIAVVNGNPAPLNDNMRYYPTIPYGISKEQAERVVIEYRDKGLKVSILRPCMIYGEGEPHAMVKILSMVRRGLLIVPDTPRLNMPLQLGYVGNVVDAIDLAAKEDRALDGSFIIADKDVISVRRFVEILYDEMSGRKPPMVPEWLFNHLLSLPPVKNRYDKYLKDRRYDISRAVEILGYSPSVGTEEGLRRTVRAWKDNV